MNSKASDVMLMQWIAAGTMRPSGRNSHRLISWIPLL